MLQSKEQFLRYMAQKLAQHRARSTLTQEMLRRSREQLATSQRLLKIEVPWVWHPEPPNEQRDNLEV